MSSSPPSSNVEAAASATSGASVASPEELEQHVQRWENIWSAGLPVGQRWDKGAPSPALMNLIASGRTKLAGKRVIVPGCGRGYDLVAFSRAEVDRPREVVGLELSTTAVAEAQQYLRSEGVLGDGNAEAAGAGSCRVSMQEGDFFLHEDTYDGGFDYTFGCAMHPAHREQWAASWARVIKPGSMLITLVFPIDPSLDPTVGPPFPVTTELYTKLLTDAGFECVDMQPVPHELSHTTREGKEVLALWRRRVWCL